MPSTRESTQASTRPPGRSTRAISAIIVSAARCTDSARSSAMTPSAQPSSRKVSREESAISGTIRPCWLCWPAGSAGLGGATPPLRRRGGRPPRAPRGPRSWGETVPPKTPSAPSAPPSGGYRGRISQVQYPQHRVAGLGGQFGPGPARARDVDEEVPAGRQPLRQLGPRHRVVELPIDRELVSVRRGDRAGRMLHGRWTPDSAPPLVGTCLAALLGGHCRRTPSCYSFPCLAGLMPALCQPAACCGMTRCTVVLNAAWQSLRHLVAC